MSTKQEIKDVESAPARWTITKMVEDWLMEHGYDGLHSDDEDNCRCSLENLFDCEWGNGRNCKADRIEPVWRSTGLPDWEKASYKMHKVRAAERAYIKACEQCDETQKEWDNSKLLRDTEDNGWLKTGILVQMEFALKIKSDEKIKLGRARESLREQTAKDTKKTSIIQRKDGKWD